MHPLPRYLTTDKRVGETPLQALERLRSEAYIPTSVPLAYAGRLDPMASGKLLILVGDECKVQERYHNLDKEYVVDILFGIGSDTHDVLGITTIHTPLHPNHTEIERVLRKYTGTITLPYPHFSSKTVGGKPLHTWTLEGRLDEITIPTKTSRIYELTCISIRTVIGNELVHDVYAKIQTIPPVDDPRKELGKDFRRADVRAGWEQILRTHRATSFTIATIRARVSSGTYMRTLAHAIGTSLGTDALAYAIHRTTIGTCYTMPLIGSFFYRKF